MTLPTPFLAVDLPVLQTNIERVATWAAGRGVALRPHVKTHKSLQLAALQLAAGATGITVATVGEAEVFAAGGFDDILIAYPLWVDPVQRERLAGLASRVRLTVGADSAEGLAGLVGLDVAVLIEVDSGHHRSGIAPERAGELAALGAELGLYVAGVFTFPGHSYAAAEGPARAAADEDAALLRAAESFRAQGIEPRTLSGGSTPSLAFSGGEASEYRPGVYVFGDAQQWELGTCTPEQIALTVHARVVSHAGGRAVLDSGSKILGADRAPYASGFGRLLDHPDARIVMLSEHHAVVELAELPALGSVVRVVPNHVCNAVNLVEELVVFDASGEQRERWPVSARGRNN
ncbi:MAG: alanine racemase [Micropruina sp.]